MQTTANSIKYSSRALRAIATLLVVLAGGALVRWLAGTAAGPAVGALRGAPVAAADALLGAVALAAAIGTAWLILGVVLEVLARLSGGIGRASRQVSAAVTPALVRRAVGIALGMGVGAGLGASPSLAAPARAVSTAAQESAQMAVLAAGGGAPRPTGGTIPATRSTTPATGGTTPATRAAPEADALPDPGWSPAPDPGWTPTAPVVRPQPDVGTVSPAGRRATYPEHVEVVVRRGDSLWAIAARHLGPGATDAEVAAEWPRWYAANRAVIGPDPDLLLPGQVLLGPEEPR